MRLHTTLTCLLTAISATGCGDGSGTDAEVSVGGASQNTGGSGGSGAQGGEGGLIGLGGNPGSGGGASAEKFAELWYAADQLLVHIALDESDGTVQTIQASTLTVDLELGQTAITMLDDGSLLGARLGKADGKSYFFFISSPPRDGSDVSPSMLGVMPNEIMLEGLYTDCDGRIYGMDTGVDDGSAEGNRLLRFTGDVTAGDFAFDVVSDLALADVADIDDMSPGIDNNQITDNPGLAIDTGNIYAFNYETGTGTQVAQAGTWGVHALGGSLFVDGRSRLYVLTSDAELIELDPSDFSPSGVLGTGPMPAEGAAGWSGLAGPLTNCRTGFTPPS